jgi:hypothetical protein
MGRRQFEAIPIERLWRRNVAIAEKVEQRTVVDVLELSYEEAAASLTCAVGTVKSRVNRGRFAFRDLYTRLGAESAGFKREPDLSGTTS